MCEGCGFALIHPLFQCSEGSLLSSVLLPGAPPGIAFPFRNMEFIYLFIYSLKKNFFSQSSGHEKHMGLATADLTLMILALALHNWAP